MAGETEGFKEILKKRLSAKRYTHSVGVANTAAKLAGMFQYPMDKAYLAGLLHDYAKDLNGSQLLEIAQEYGLIQDPVEILRPDLLHGPVAAFLLKKEGMITDPQILHAIQYHTTGYPEMDWLARLIYVADYIEPGREFPGVERLRQISYKDINLGMLAGLDHTMRFLIEQGGFLHPYSVQIRNRLIEEFSMKASH